METTIITDCGQKLTINLVSGNSALLTEILETSDKVDSFLTSPLTIEWEVVLPKASWLCTLNQTILSNIQEKLNSQNSPKINAVKYVRQCTDKTLGLLEAICLVERVRDGYVKANEQFEVYNERA